MKTDFANEAAENAVANGTGRSSRSPLPSSAIDASLLMSSVDCLDAAIVICDAGAADCPIIFASRGLTVMTQHTAPKVIGQKLSFLFHPETAPDNLQRILQSLVRRSACREEFRCVRNQTPPLWCELTLTPIAAQDNGASYFIALIT
ncbi:MAG: hypothetical protein JWQ04_1638, partial [Pedosphaera sp.]|nr:hypothetical protein [Pedosphaera sp.]